MLNISGAFPPQAQPPQPAISAVHTELEQNHRVLLHLMDTLVSQIKDYSDDTDFELQKDSTIKNTIVEILSFISRSNQKDQLSLKVSQAVVNSLFGSNESKLCRDVLSLLLEKLCSLSMVARKDVVWWLVYALDPRKFNVPVVRSLLEVNLINIAELDAVLVTAMKNGMTGATEFSMNLIRDTVMSDSPILMRLDFIRVLGYLRTVKTPEIKEFLDEYEQCLAVPVSKNTPVTKTKRYYLVFTEWVKLQQRVESDDVVNTVFIRQLFDKGVIDNKEKIIEFTKAALELSVNSFKQSDPTGEVFTSIDALSRLITALLVVQDFDVEEIKEYLNLLLSVVTLVFAKDHQTNNTSFNERPYFRLYSSLLSDWDKLRDHNFIRVSNPVIRKSLIEFDQPFFDIFASFLHSYQPIAFPGFSFAWITLISHRMFLPKVLRSKERYGWDKLVLLLIDLMKFLSQYVKKGNIPDSISVIYKGTLRVFIGIANDVPEFLIQNHYKLVKNVPPTCLQLRNIILSAIPKKMMITDPFSSEITEDNCVSIPKVFYDPSQDLKSLKKPVINYLRIPSTSILRTICGALFRTELEYENGIGYDENSVDVGLIHAIVTHVAVEVGLEVERASKNAVFNVKSSYYTLLFGMLSDGNDEVKLHVIQAMVNQLRYSNVHTHWFNFALKLMFQSTEWPDDQLQTIQEVILRVLLERIIVNKPHPWGVVVTFMDLLRLEGPSMIEKPFVTSTPEIHTIIKNMQKYAISS